MSLAAGSVTVADNGTRTGSGAAVALYDALIAMPAIAAQLALPDSVDTSAPRPWPAYLPASGKLSIKRGQAEIANAMAQLIPYLTTNAVITGNAHVTNQSLGRTPDPNNANTAIQAPSSPVDIPLSGTALG